MVKSGRIRGWFVMMAWDRHVPGRRPWIQRGSAGGWNIIRVGRLGLVWEHSGLSLKGSR